MKLIDHFTLNANSYKKKNEWVVCVEIIVWEYLMERWYEMVVAYHIHVYSFSDLNNNHQTFINQCEWECNLSRYQFYAKPQPFNFIESTESNFEPNKIVSNRIQATISHHVPFSVLVASDVLKICVNSFELNKLKGPRFIWTKKNAKYLGYGYQFIM